jgi:HK97 gp10 family phage protein
MGQGALALMAFDFDVKVTASPGLIDRMSTLPEKLQRKGAVAAARQAMRLVVNAARAEARNIDDPETRENIAKNIISQNSPRSGRRIGGVAMRVGVRGGAAFSKAREAQAAGNPGGYTWYWRFLELGAERVPREEFLLPALMRNAQAVTDNLTTELAAQIVKLTPK